jgi:hypothetical protein
MWNLVAQRALLENSLALAQTLTATATHIATQQLCRSLSLYNEIVRNASQNYAQALSCGRLGMARSGARQLELFSSLAALSMQLPIWRLSITKGGLQSTCVAGDWLPTWPVAANSVQSIVFPWIGLTWLGPQRLPAWLSACDRLIPAAVPSNAKTSYSAYRSPSGHAVTQIYFSEPRPAPMIRVFNDAPIAFARLNPFIAGWQGASTLSHH